MVLELTPIHQREANAFVSQHHRHHGPVVGSLFQVGVADSGAVVGVGIAGRPVSRHLDDGWTVEVTRVATDGTPNACSMLYGALARAAFSLGYRRVVTYTQKNEGGSSLRAAGWRVVAERKPGGTWNTPSRPRVNVNPRQHTFLWERTGAKPIYRCPDCSEAVDPEVHECSGSPLTEFESQMGLWGRAG